MAIKALVLDGEELKTAAYKEGDMQARVYDPQGVRKDAFYTGNMSGERLSLDSGIQYSSLFSLVSGQASLIFQANKQSSSIFIGINGKLGEKGQVISAIDDSGAVGWVDLPAAPGGWQQLKLNDDGISANLVYNGETIFTFREVDAEKASLNPEFDITMSILGGAAMGCEKKNFPKGKYTEIVKSGLINTNFDENARKFPPIEYIICDKEFFVRY